MKKLTHLIPLSLLLCQLSIAQDLPDEEQALWFKVELLVFSHEGGSGAASEHWNPLPPLAYPDTFRFLIEPDKIEANLAAHDADGIVDEFGRQILTLRAPVEIEEAAPYGVTPTENSYPAEPEPEATEEPEPGNIVVEEPPVSPTPFVALPAAELTLRGKAAYMSRSGRYQTLTHRAWVQPFESREETLAIILDDSGDTQRWPRLQGSVLVYLSRYLHLETNIWLNTQGSYLSGNWRMPPPPLGPPGLIIEEPPSIDLETLTELPPVEASPGEENLEIAPPEEYLLFEEPPEPVYPYRHAILLKQKRRMRSTEVHYIDHPMLGLVIRIDPLTEEELQLRADAEFGTLESESTQEMTAPGSR